MILFLFLSLSISRSAPFPCPFCPRSATLSDGTLPRYTLVPVSSGLPYLQTLRNPFFYSSSYHTIGHRPLDMRVNALYRQRASPWVLPPSSFARQKFKFKYAYRAQESATSARWDRCSVESGSSYRTAPGSIHLAQVVSPTAPQGVADQPGPRSTLTHPSRPAPTSLEPQHHQRRRLSDDDEVDDDSLGLGSPPGGAAIGGSGKNAGQTDPSQIAHHPPLSPTVCKPPKFLKGQFVYDFRIVIC